MDHLVRLGQLGVGGEGREGDQIALVEVGVGVAAEHEVVLDESAADECECVAAGLRHCSFDFEPLAVEVDGLDGETADPAHLVAPGRECQSRVVDLFEQARPELVRTLIGQPEVQGVARSTGLGRIDSQHRAVDVRSTDRRQVSEVALGR